MSPAPTRDDVVGLYREGMLAVAAVGETLPADAWALPACGSWTATEVARHLLGVVRWYDEWLDRAIAGDLTAPFAAADMDRENTAALERLATLTAAEAIGTFLGEAGRYLDRVDDHWDRPFAFPFGTVTAGLHCAIAATEWHMHAFDLSGLGAIRHAPTRPEVLFVAAGRCVAAAEGGFRGARTRVLLPLAARRDPWGSMLRRSGRAD